mgnify:CR=1 FL=1
MEMKNLNISNMRRYIKETIIRGKDFFMKFWTEYTLKEKSQIAQIILTIFTIILVYITYFGILQSNKYTRQQIELQYRPYLAVIDPSYFIRLLTTGQWQYMAYFPVTNFGNKPAFELNLINDKVILIEPSKEKLKELNDIRNDSTKTQSEKDIAYVKYVTYRKGLIKLVADYLIKHPKATHEQLVNYFKNFAKYVDNRKQRIFFNEEGEADFKVDSRSDIYGSYPEPSLLLPYRPEVDKPKKTFPLGREIHPSTDLHISNYDKILFVYFAAEYEGIVKQRMPYSIYYLGYHDEFLNPVSGRLNIEPVMKSSDQATREVITLIPFTEFKIWSDRTIIE